MKKLLFILLLLGSYALGYSQSEETGGSSTDTPVKVPKNISPVRDTSIITHKEAIFHQKLIEEFTELEFDTVYMIQYAIVTEVTSMPQNSVALPFVMTDMIMYFVISDRYYTSYKQAKAIGEKVRADNIQFEYYIVKPCVVPVSSPMIAKRNNDRKGAFRIQYTSTITYPEKVLDHFMVELHKGNFRQISERAFENKTEATSWLLEQGHRLKDFWIYPVSAAALDDKNTLNNSQATSQP
ncbi:MAG: hypothetical protein ACPGJS_17225 [Flammeovirgaceae bacterium]